MSKESEYRLNGMFFISCNSFPYGMRINSRRELNYKNKLSMEKQKLVLFLLFTVML